jgi:hypothetical protein
MVNTRKAVKRLSEMKESVVEKKNFKQTSKKAVEKSYRKKK